MTYIVESVVDRTDNNQANHNMFHKIHWDGEDVPKWADNTHIHTQIKDH